MSEYQYYEFQAVDRKLTDRQMDELRRCSSRAKITSTSFRNEYSYGDFRGDENAWMEKYFDGFVYLANWGTHILQLRVSRGLIPLKTARQYCPGHGAEVREKSGHLIFTFTSQEEGGDWVDSEGVLSSLFPLRTELAQGDLRSLYLGWLLCAQGGELDDDTLEPPVPPNLGKPSRALSNFIDFLRIDDDLLNVALRTSVKTPASRRPRGEIARWVASLDVREKDKLLVRLLEEEAAPVGVELRVRFNRSQVERTTVTKTRRRTVGELLAAVEGSSGVELKQI